MYLEYSDKLHRRKAAAATASIDLFIGSRTIAQIIGEYYWTSSRQQEYCIKLFIKKDKEKTASSHSDGILKMNTYS
jgi:hypothetical protein